MTNALHPHDRTSSDRWLNKHQDSIMTSLAHRLEVAKATNNLFLIKLLEREKQQAVPTPTHPVAQSHWWQTVTQYLTNVLFGGSALQVCEIVDGRDHWWVAADPQTGQFVYADSEAELRLWIKENYQGR